MKVPKLKRLKLLKPRHQDGVERPRGVHIYVLPNLFTTGNMFFGFFSIILCLNEDYIRGAYAIVFAAVFDALDGRVARLTQATSKFGMEYDSLADLISFGAAPALLMYTWALKPFDRIGWLACFLYLACTALRLARFNVQAATVEKKYFQGLPSPMAAGIVSTSVLAVRELGFAPEKNIFLLLMTFLLGFVMVSNFRYRSFKELDFKSEKKPFFILIVGVCVLVFILVKPEVNLFVAFMSYAIMGAVAGIFSPTKARLNQVIVARSKRKEIRSEESTNHHEPYNP